jgi:hypothetical protein
MSYNIWYAISYEITNYLIEHDARWEINWIVRKVRSFCFPDWVMWKTEKTLEAVDKQIEEIKSVWEAEDKAKYIDPIITEHEPDGSKAQELLGGTIQISAPWYKPKD